MLKIRMQGTKEDIRWYQRCLEQDKGIQVLQVSKVYANKGTERFFCAYAEVERRER